MQLNNRKSFCERNYNYYKIFLKRKLLALRVQVGECRGLAKMLRIAKLFYKRRVLYARLGFLRKVEPVKRNRIIQDIYELIKQSKDPHLFDRNAERFMYSDIDKGKWYHRSPDLWILYNGLAWADEQLEKRVFNYLKNERRKAV